jgi:secreted trypsin-like serine protease
LLTALLSISTVATAQAQQRFACTEPGKGLVERIMGGQPAQPGDWPWQVFIRTQATDGVQFACGGSLIHPQWVLTAAHCAFYPESRVQLPLDPMFVMHGSNDLNAGGARKHVAQFLAHEEYDPISKHNDIALIKLDSPFDAIPAQIVKLESPRLERAFGQPGDCAAVTGWGRIQETGPTETWLRQVDVPIVEPAQCNQAYQGITIIEAKTQVCADWKKGKKDSCPGDSGGPLVVQGGPSGWTQIGIVSYGYGCGRPDAYGVYTRVSDFIGWILPKTRNN